MKYFLKVFLITTLILSAVLGILSYAYLNYSNTARYNAKSSSEKELDDEIRPVTDRDRVGILLLGVDGERADTIIFGTFNLIDNKIDLISIPRDTYYESGYNGAQMQKINAIYVKEGVRGTIDAAEDLLGVENQINYYALIDYEGVKNLVDVVGGVEVDVPFDMEYEDPYSDPPLDIDIKEGRQVLKGQKAVDFLRFRTNNDYTAGYREGDIGRIESQQQFISSFLDKALGIRLPLVINTAMKEVKTNIRLRDSLSYGMNLREVAGEDIQIRTIPGEARYSVIQGENLSYYFPDKTQTEEMIEEIFAFESESNTEELENSGEF